MDALGLREKIERIFKLNFKEREELGASVSVWIGGREIISLAEGYCEKECIRPWDETTLVPVWSATKGIASACVLKILDEQGLSLDIKVVEIWPEFGRSGKENISFKDVLTHGAGIPALNEQVSVFNYNEVIKAIEMQAPLWAIGVGHGYHPRTFGFLLDEFVRRLEGISLGRYFNETFAVPMGLEFWIGLPQEYHSRVATLYPGKMSNPDDEEAFYKAFMDSESLTRKAFGSPAGLGGVSGMNSPDSWSAGWPAMGGIGTAQALAKFYSMLANGGEWDGKKIVSKRVLSLMEEPLISGEDKVLCLGNAFSAGFMKGRNDLMRRKLFGSSKSAYGHSGAGGSHAFADPENRIAFAYTMNQMNYGVLPGPKSIDMVDVLYGL
jgi:CubicO group peptidase (beta-lactamase class C family)